MKTTWRPIFAFVCIGIFALYNLTVMFLLMSGREALADASGIIIATFGVIGGVTGIYTYKRTTEKLNDVA